MALRAGDQHALMSGSDRSGPALPMALVTESTLVAFVSMQSRTRAGIEP